MTAPQIVLVSYLLVGIAFGIRAQRNLHRIATGTTKKKPHADLVYEKDQSGTEWLGVRGDVMRVNASLLIAITALVWPLVIVIRILRRAKATS